MSPVKDAVWKLLQTLPDGCTLEDVQYHLYIRQKVERGLEAVEKGEVLSEEEADRRITTWLESFGPSQP